MPGLELRHGDLERAHRQTDETEAVLVDDLEVNRRGAAERGARYRDRERGHRTVIDDDDVVGTDGWCRSGEQEQGGRNGAESRDDVPTKCSGKFLQHSKLPAVATSNQVGILRRPRSMGPWAH
jgi:hypothetical protein